MTWSSAIGILILLAGIITSITLYAIKKKWYPVMFIISVGLLVFTSIFIIDVFDLSKNGILIVLASTTVVMLAIGYYSSKTK